MTLACPSVRFFHLNGGQRVAYATHGSGPPLVCPAWWVSHLEEDWEDAGFRDLFGGLATHHTVIRYDRPGAGLSDRGRNTVVLEDEIATLSALIDHLALEHFSLFAVSCAGPPALGYAAQHPERIAKLIFFGSFLRGRDVGPTKIKDAIQGLVRAHWGMGSRAITNLFAPDLLETEVKRVTRQHRRAASPEMAAELLSLTFDVDVEATASTVMAPALVLHRKGDQTVRHDAGRVLAASLPNAAFQTLEGNAHVPWWGDVGAVRDAVLGFLNAAPQENRATEAPMRSENALYRCGDVWTATFEGRSVHIKNARGLADLALLLSQPGRQIHVGTLFTGTEGIALGEADPVLDEAALEAYKARLHALESAIQEAEAMGRVERVERHKDELETLSKELRSAVGFRGRKRGLRDPKERARKAVTARIRASIKKITEIHPELGEHLTRCIRTGLYCTYAPQPPVEWALSEAL